jgi:phosphate-selective porin OprO and OprP
VAFSPLLVGELDYRVQSNEVEGPTGFALGRFRLGGELRPTESFLAVGSVEWALEKPLLVDAWVQLSPMDGLHLSLGYGKTPLFASAKDVAVEALSIPELSLPVRALWPQRDLGLEAQFSPRDVPLEAWVRVGNGSGSPLGNDNAEPAVDVRLDGLWGGASRSAAPDTRWGLRLGGGVHGENAFDRAGAGGTTPTNFLFYRAVPVSGVRWVTEGHAVFWHGPFQVTAEGGVAWEQRSRDTDGNPDTPRERLPGIRTQGGAVELSWLARGSRRAVRGWPSGPPGTEGLLNRGAVEVAARVERLVAGLGAPDVQTGGARGGAVAVRWWATDFVGAGVAGYWLRYDQPPIEAPDRRDSWLVLSRVTVSFR